MIVCMETENIGIAANGCTKIWNLYMEIWNILYYYIIRKYEQLDVYGKEQHVKCSENLLTSLTCHEG